MPATAPMGRKTNRKPDGPLTVEQRNALVMAWLKRWPYPAAYIRGKLPHLLRVAYHHGFTDEDVNAACMAAGVEAARRFDPARGVKFTSFLVWQLRAAVQRLVYRDQEDARKRGGAPVVSLNTPVLNGKGDADDLAVLIPSDEPDASEASDRAELADTLWAAVERATLSNEDRLVVELRYGLNGHERHSLAEIAAMLGVSKEAVRQRQERMLRRCREELEATFPELCGDPTDAPR